MKKKPFPLIAVCCFLVLACNKISLEKGSDKASEPPAQAQSEYTADSEVVTPPTPITGAYLSCARSPTDDSTNLVTIFCSIKIDGELANLDDIFANYTWSVEGYSDVQIATLPASSGAQVAFTFPALDENQRQTILAQGNFILEARRRDGEDFRFDKNNRRDSGGSSGSANSFGDGGGSTGNFGDGGGSTGSFGDGSGGFGDGAGSFGDGAGSFGNGAGSFGDGAGSFGDAVGGVAGDALDSVGGLGGDPLGGFGGIGGP